MLVASGVGHNPIGGLFPALVLGAPVVKGMPAFKAGTGHSSFRVTAR
jgi:hypothetical protein